MKIIAWELKQIVVEKVWCLNHQRKSHGIIIKMSAVSREFLRF